LTSLACDAAALHTEPLAGPPVSWCLRRDLGTAQAVSARPVDSGPARGRLVTLRAGAVSLLMPLIILAGRRALCGLGAVDPAEPATGHRNLTLNICLATTEGIRATTSSRGTQRI